MSSRAVLLVAPLALLITACGSSTSTSKSTVAGAPTTTGAATTTTTSQRPRNNLAIQRAPGIGAVLVSGTGQALYVYTPEKGGAIKCTGACASVWPPLKLLVGTTPAISSAVHPNLVGTVTDPSGGRIITYAGWPLHTYASDASHGTYRGQGSGGQWYLISPSGPVITKPVNTGTSGY
jgi:predicted lipoprotein with Yx(FWY)xxD motif